MCLLHGLCAPVPLLAPSQLQLPVQGLSLGLPSNEWVRLRRDVLTCTHWGAPIVWEGTFHPEILQQEYGRWDLTIGPMVFAVGRYLAKYLEHFLVTAEEHLMLRLATGRHLQTLMVENQKRRQDISMMRMHWLSQGLDPAICREAQYVFCMDVNQFFVGAFGSEALAESVALLHSYFDRAQVKGTATSSVWGHASGEEPDGKLLPGCSAGQEKRHGGPTGMTRATSIRTSGCTSQPRSCLRSTAGMRPSGHVETPAFLGWCGLRSSTAWGAQQIGDSASKSPQGACGWNPAWGLGE
ncbi:Alpha-1,3-galactosyltransferase 2 [Platysternon megacephalum]|uniref:Alpha-1,3-galactosyltransferase 2 n=1 Tax=Platysternon megacephalum TaxID=55544 RepID=A0A4D9DYQ1_9SAUR|nr:Alpha-1,3-galactosyltransferase 2 [Platysternon megacephalum]